MKKSAIHLLLATVSLSFAGLTFASTTEQTIDAKTAYNHAKENAESSYKIANEKCNAFKDNQKDVCKAEADLAKVRAKSEAEATYKGTLSARISAREDIAGAEYDLAKTKCASQTGNKKDVCIKQAKAVEVAAKADAKADKKVVNALVDAQEDKADANYKVALEKCDPLTGAVKDKCVASAKIKFGK